MKEVKAFSVKMPKELWSFLKKRSVDCDMKMNEIIISLLEKYRKRIENKLTTTET